MDCAERASTAARNALSQEFLPNKLYLGLLGRAYRIFFVVVVYFIFLGSLMTL